MRLRRHARVAVVGAGPSGLVAAKHALGGGVRPGGLRSERRPRRAVACDGRPQRSVAGDAHEHEPRDDRVLGLPAPADHPLHPAAEQIHAYLRAYADRFGVTERIRLRTPVARLARVGTSTASASTPWSSPPAASASRACRRGLTRSTASSSTPSTYPGAEPFRGRRTLVYGNGISGLEIASDLAAVTGRVSAFRKPRYVIQKVVDGVSSDWQWYTAFGALERRSAPREELSRTLRERVLRVAGNPAAFGAPEPRRATSSPRASRCARTTSRRSPTAASSAARRSPRSTAATVTFADGSRETVDAIVCATGYDLDIPYLDDASGPCSAPTSRSTSARCIPTCPASASSASSSPRARTSRCSSCRRAGSSRSGQAMSPPPDEARMRASDRRAPPPLDPHNALATTLADELGVAPDLLSPPRAHRGRCCSARCSRRATASTARALARTPPSTSPSSSPRRRGARRSRRRRGAAQVRLAAAADVVARRMRGRS